MDIDIKEEKLNSEDSQPSTTGGSVLFPTVNKFSHIKNKLVRTEKFKQAQRLKNKVSTLLFYVL